MQKFKFLFSAIFLGLMCFATPAIAQTVEITAIDFAAGEGPTDTATFEITRDTVGTFDLDVLFDVDPAFTTAGAGDFILNPPAGSVTIPAGSISVTVTLTAVDDIAAETDEDIELQLLPSPGYTVGVNDRDVAFIMANDFVVTNTNDFDLVLNPTPAQREGTLRQAIENAGVLGFNPVVEFADDPFADAPAETISLTGGEIRIQAPMQIQGPGADQLTVEGFDLNRVFVFSNTDGGFNSVVSGLTFAGGTASNPGPDGRGGAIQVDGSLGLGGINLLFRECSFAGNRALEGAAIGFSSDGGNLGIVRCLFEDNLATTAGGAVGFFQGSEMIISDSTFAHNRSSGPGGAVLVASGAATITNATIVGNRSDENDGGQPGDTGGGLRVEAGGNCVINNTLIAGNQRGLAAPVSDEIAGTLAAASANNLIADPATAGGLTDGTNSNQVGDGGGIFPLGRLIETEPSAIPTPLIEDHGGPTRSVRLVRTSPAIEQGNPSLNGELFDQRGNGFPRSRSAFPDQPGPGTIDIGALEFDPILVTTVTDEDNGDPDPSLGDGTSLREAIAAANRSPGTDLIVFSSGNNGTTNFFDAGAPKTISPDSQFEVNTSIDIDGPGRTLLTLDGDVDNSGDPTDSDTRLFVFNAPLLPGRTPNSSLSGMTLLGGSGWAGSVLEPGGAIINDANLLVFGMIMENNTGSDGGAIFNNGGLNIFDVTLRNNDAIDGGGAIFNTQFVTIQRTTIVGNSAFEGGGIFNASGTLRLVNSTLSGNTGTEGGGFLYEGGTVRIANSTIAENSSEGTPGGGIRFSNLASAPTVELDNTIVAGNTTGTGVTAPSDIGGPFDIDLPTSFNNLIADSGSAGGLGDGNNGNIVGFGGAGIIPFNEILEPLANYGGVTDTYLPASGSLAIDNGDDSSATVTSGGAQLTADQRGFLRFDGPAVDIGSVEEEFVPPGFADLDPIGNFMVIEGDNVNFTATATTDLGPPEFSLEDGPGAVPAGASIDPDTGEFNWLTDNSHALQTFQFDVVVVDSGDPAASDRETITIDVDELFMGGFADLDPIGNFQIVAGDNLTFTATAFTDLGPPEFFLQDGPGAVPAGATIDQFSGDFSWQTDGSHAPGNFQFDVVVFDSGDPFGAFDSETITIQVDPAGPPTVSLTANAGSAHEPGSFSNGPPALAPASHLRIERNTTSGDLIVDLEIGTGSTAGLGTDYQMRIVGDINPIVFNGDPSTAQITIPDGETVREIIIDATDDAAAEAAEVIDLSLAVPPGVTLVGGGLVVTIPQNDFAVTGLDDFDTSTNPNAGEGTLRQALINAKAGLNEAGSPVQPAEIVFAAGVAGNLLLEFGPLMLDSAEFTITGPGADQLSIDGGGNSRVLEAFDPNDFNPFFVSGLTITGGSTAGNGGGIFNSQALTLTDCVISGCTAENGGAITNEGDIGLQGCLVTGNTANAYGGGFDNHGGFATIRESTISDNNAPFGGGIENTAGGNLVVDRSTVSANTATFSGGGIDTFNAFTDVVDSTISGNGAGYGAGAFNEMGQLFLTNTTVAMNNASSSTGGVLSSANEPAAETTLGNSIVAGNIGGDLSTNDPVFVDVTAKSGFNLIGDANSAGGLIDGTGGNIVGINGAGIRPIDTIVDPLSDNGGPTLTHALALASVAIDAGSNAVGNGSGPTDQRGTGFERIFNGVIDIGSYEWIVREKMAMLSCEIGISGSGSEAKITWETSEGKQYDILCSTDLIRWVMVASEVPSGGEQTSWTDQDPPAGSAFYIARESKKKVTGELDE